MQLILYLPYIFYNYLLIDKFSLSINSGGLGSIFESLPIIKLILLDGSVQVLKY